MKTHKQLNSRHMRPIKAIAGLRQQTQPSHCLIVCLCDHNSISISRSDSQPTDSQVCDSEPKRFDNCQTDLNLFLLMSDIAIDRY